jgi:hypothetical protein
LLLSRRRRRSLPFAVPFEAVALAKELVAKPGGARGEPWLRAPGKRVALP